LSKLDSTKKAHLSAKAIFENKGEKIIILDLRQTMAPYDYFVIAQSGSRRRLVTCAKAVKEALKKNSYSVFSVEGEKEGEWVLVDASDVVIHLLSQERREYYDLEGLWHDTPRTYYEEIAHK